MINNFYVCLLCLQWPSPYLHSTISFLEVDEGIIFQFLHPLQLAKLTEGLFKHLLCDSASQVPHKQHLDLVIKTKDSFFLFLQKGEQIKLQETVKRKTNSNHTYTSTNDLWPCALPWPWPLGPGPQWDQPTPQWPHFPTPSPCRSSAGGGPELPFCGLHTPRSKSPDSFSCRLAGGTIWHHLDPLQRQWVGGEKWRKCSRWLNWIYKTQISYL